MTTSVFVDTVRALAAAHRVDVDVATENEVGAGGGARTVVGRRRSTVTVSSALTREPVAVQAFMAAHEVAHVVLRHRYRTRAWPGALWALSISVMQVLVLLTLLDRPPGTSFAFMAKVLTVVVGFLGPLAAGLGAQLLLAWRTRACETAADRQALIWGYQLAGSEAALAAGETRLSTSRWYRPFRMHPLPADRIQASRRPPIGDRP